METFRQNAGEREFRVRDQCYWRNEELQGSRALQEKEEVVELGKNSDGPILR